MIDQDRVADCHRSADQSGNTSALDNSSATQSLSKAAKFQGRRGFQITGRGESGGGIERNHTGIDIQGGATIMGESQAVTIEGKCVCAILSQQT